MPTGVPSPAIVTTITHPILDPRKEGGAGTIFDSSYLAEGKTYGWNFNYAGTFDYCTLYPFMKRKIIVK